MQPVIKSARFIFILCVLYLFCCACHKTPPTDRAIIKGHITDLKKEKIFLQEAGTMDHLLDSSEVTNGNFSFSIPFKNKQPFQVILCVRDTEDNIPQLNTLGFEDPYNKEMVRSILYAEPGETIIEGERFNRGPFPRFKGGKQSESLHKNYQFSFSLPYTANTDARKKALELYKEKIEAYPYSLSLLETLAKAREDYSPAELNYLLKTFNNEVRNSTVFSEFQFYIKNRDKYSKTVLNMALSTPANKKEKILDTTQKFNLIVFWASWCGPCIEEIPQLKKIYQQYHNKGLAITSISLDINLRNWKATIKQENMPWKQLIVKDTDRVLMSTSYDVHVVPIVFLTDQHGNIISKKQGGFSDSAYQKLLAGL
ncbi:MAG: hypothetical protein JWN76_2735 [Chitinophagaceae bacterium]|nr:hypothetical protein [Chitinophagaceae bacterium]